MNRRLITAWLLLECVWVLACERAPEPAAAMPEEPPPATTEAEPVALQEPSPERLVSVTGPGLLDRVRAAPQRAQLINVWASWCGNCRKELPMIVRVAEAFASDGLGLMLVSADEPKDYDAAHGFLQELAPGRAGYIVEGSLAPFKRALHPTWKGSIPSTFLYDRQGVLRHTWLGPVYAHELTPVIQDFMGAEGEATADDDEAAAL